MNASGKAIRRAPSRPAAWISSQALSTVASRFKNTGAACTAATLKGAWFELDIVTSSSEADLANPASGSFVEGGPGAEAVYAPLPQPTCGDCRDAACGQVSLAPDNRVTPQALQFNMISFAPGAQDEPLRLDR